MLEKRKSPRRKMVLPVKVSIDRVDLLAYTVDTTDGGAGWGPPNAVATGNDRKFAARVAQSQVSNRLGSGTCPQRTTGGCRMFGVT